MAEQKRRVALVTGGAVRVGRAIVERLSKAGFYVAFTYRSSESEALDLAEMIDGHAIRDVDLASDCPVRS
jgi:pteridine reductase